MLRLISAHRLDQEKWRDLIIGWLKSNEMQTYLSQWAILYDIYGDGSMREEIQALAKQHPQTIHYHGYLPLNQILSKWINYDFVLMPSHFLETFWLTALDFAQFWVPTIGFQKWWLKQFVSDYCAIPSQWSPDQLQGNFNKHMMKILIDALHGKTPSPLIDKQYIINTYNQESWYQQFMWLLSL